jgi:ferredoxin
VPHLKYHPERCIGCAGCEAVCNIQRDGLLSTMLSSIMFHVEEENGYFGIIVKRQGGGLLIGRPEGVEIRRPGEIAGGNASAKPIAMRPACDMCHGKPQCVMYCPTDALEEGD